MTAVCIVAEFVGPNLKGVNNMLIQRTLFHVSAQQYAEMTIEL